MKIKIRFATEGDVEQIQAIKSQLIVPATLTDMNRGGFIREPNRDEYLFFIQNAHVIVLEDLRRNIIAGFVIGIPDAMLRRSPIWEQRKSVQWFKPNTLELLEKSKLCYFEQIGVLPDAAYKIYAPALALALLKILFDEHQLLLATIVHEPVQNLASLALMESLYVRQLGTIEREYPEVGRYSLGVYCIEQSVFRQRVEDPITRPRLAVKILNMMDSLTEKSENLVD
ncbi:hypothetical protein JYQ62_10795 [Nostoc sp. UHCC 0702]|nr:hypothetical protein JYQ62_10795 [Nostoc sp. UHCC 0702]